MEHLRCGDSVGERVAMNSPIQGTAADIIKYAMVHVYDVLKAKGLKSKLILQIHDVSRLIQSMRCLVRPNHPAFVMGFDIRKHLR